MSFQAYLDNIEEKTGKTPREFIAMAKAKGFTDPKTKTGDILIWLKEDFDLGRGHGMAIVHIIKKGDAVDAKFVNSGGAHSDPSDRLNLNGKTSSFMYSIHHVAITASDFERSLEFYQKLGFKVLANRHLSEKQKKIALLQSGNFKLELFWFEDLKDEPATRETIGNNVHDVGAKHFALRVDSVDEVRTHLKELKIPLESEPATGDTGYDFFFIRDPDGIWIEFVQDDKYD